MRRGSLWWLLGIGVLWILTACAPRPTRPTGPVLVGPEARTRYLRQARDWRWPRRVEAEGVFVAHSDRWGEVSGWIRLFLADTALGVVLEGPLGIPLGQVTVPLAQGMPALPETLPWGIFWRWVQDPLRYPADTVRFGTSGTRWVLSTPAGVLRVDELDSRPPRLYISLRRRYRIMLEDIRPVQRHLWPFRVRYQGPEGTLEITWRRVTIPE